MGDVSSFEIELRRQISNNTFHYLSETSDWYDTIEGLVSDGQSRLILPIDVFDQVAGSLSNLLLTNPLVYFSACEEGYQKVYESILQAHGGASKGPLHTPHLGVRSWLGSHTVTPRGLSARLVNRLVCVEGIVTRCSVVRSKLSRSVHVCEANGYVVTREHHDNHSLQRDAELISRGVPKTDKDGNPLKIEVALCGFRDTQSVTLQEMPESAPTGQLPRSVEVCLEDDLIDSVKPGDRVRIFGVYRAVAFKKGQHLSGLSRAFLIANNIEKLKKDALSPDITPVDIRMIREIAARPDAFDLLSQSMAPSICGHDIVKKGLLLQLLGGHRKELENGMKLRGDIHILLIGDPSCGKSQLLRFIMNTAPLALSTTGRGSSGVGLTAAVTTDRDTGDRRLEAGAMVLADGGLVCIDEFDKMSSEDRVAIHEVMEQQTVTISKAGVHTSLNARTSVLAAANPVYGSFDSTAPLKSQITFPDSLLTRFDLIYIIRDSQSSESDRRICSQVIRQLQYRTPSDSLVTVSGSNRQGSGRGVTDEEWGVLQPVVDKNKKQGEARYWETSVVPSTSLESVSVQKVLSVEFLQKFLYYVRNGRDSPVLGNDAMASIAKFYAELRQTFADDRQPTSQSHRRVIPTARTLEACVRLATAHAKLKLKNVVDEEDAKQAQDLLLYTLTGHPPDGYTKDGTRIPISTPVVDALAKNLSHQRRKRPRDDSHGVTQEPAEAAAGASAKKSNLARSHDEAHLVTSLAATSLEERVPEPDTVSQGSVDSLERFETAGSSRTIAPKRLRTLTRVLGDIQLSISADSVVPHELLNLVNQRLSGKEFAFPEFLAGLRKLQSENKIMLVNEEVWFI